MSRELRNLGAASWRMLERAGIRDVAQLRNMGAALAYVAVPDAGCSPSRNLLWAIAAGLQGRDWRDLRQDEKAALLLEVDLLRQTRSDSGGGA